MWQAAREPFRDAIPFLKSERKDHPQTATEPGGIMSLTSSRVASARVAGILTFGLVFVALGACVPRSPVGDPPSPAGRVQSVRNFPGVTVTRTPSGGFRMRVVSGLVGEGDPLYVIDDTTIPVEPSRGIDWFQPEDIVRITVLKDPAETTVYGPAGINGVILITTRQGMRTKKRTMPQTYLGNETRSNFSHEPTPADFPRDQPDSREVATTLVD